MSLIYNLTSPELSRGWALQPLCIISFQSQSNSSDFTCAWEKREYMTWLDYDDQNKGSEVRLPLETADWHDLNASGSQVEVGFFESPLQKDELPTSGIAIDENESHYNPDSEGKFELSYFPLFPIIPAEAPTDSLLQVEVLAPPHGAKSQLRTAGTFGFQMFTLCLTLPILLVPVLLCRQEPLSPVSVNVDANLIEYGDLDADLKPIGKGATCLVYPTSDGHHVLKVLYPFKRIGSEVKTHSSLDHANIVKLRKLVILRTEDRTAHALKMDRYDETLREHLRNKNLDLKSRIEILRQVLAGLSEIHSNGYIHRDLHSMNVLVRRCSNGHFNCAISDFGMSKELDAKEAEGEMLESSYGSGSIEMKHIRPPEDTFGYASDVFAFGVLMWEVLSQRDILQESENANNQPVSKYIATRLKRSRMHKEFKTVIRSCLAKEPSERPTTKELSDFLVQFQESNQIPVM
jgi:hypothetical protein